MDFERYTVTLRKEESAGEWAWVARIAELPGCAATEETAEAALKHIQESAQTYVEMTRESGRPVPPPLTDPSGRFTIRVPRWVHRELKAQADADGISLNQYVASILTYWAGYGVPPRAHRSEDAKALLVSESSFVDKDYTNR